MTLVSNYFLPLMLLDALSGLNYVSVFIAAISSMVVGSFIYSPAMWGKRWMKLVGLTEGKAKTSAGTAMGAAFVLSLLTAIVLSILIGPSAGLMNGLVDGLVVGIGIAITSVLTHQLFEQRPTELMGMTVVHELITFAVMGSLIGLLG